jgi:hypothetical protein
VEPRRTCIPVAKWPSKKELLHSANTDRKYEQSSCVKNFVRSASDT